MQEELEECVKIGLLKTFKIVFRARDWQMPKIYGRVTCTVDVGRYQLA